jgi:hypothetical protein
VKLRALKKRDEVREAKFQETEAFLKLAAERLAQEGCGNMEWLEFGLRAAMQKDARSLVEGLLNDPALAVPKDRAFAGEKCYRNRSKVIETLFGKVELRRNYYYSAKSQAQGRLPLDDALGLIEGYSPGLARLMCRIAAEQSYELAGADLLAYAGVSVEGRAIQRMASLMGPKMRAARQSQPEPASPKAIPIMYVSADGTGVPMMRGELENRKGRQPDGSARTREVKLGCVFTQQGADAEGNPLRDPSSTTYIGALETAADFGLQLRQEAIRRGMAGARKMVFLGDGAPWVWEQARINFPNATCILDFYHAFEHLGALSEALEGKGSPAAKRRTARWAKSMKKGGIERILASAQKLLDSGTVADGLEAGRQIEYFRKNQHRMRYDRYRQQHLFIRSGVVEAGCRTVIGQRLKKSGMFWSQPGAQNVIDLRCALLGGHFDHDWTRLTNLRAH